MSYSQTIKLRLLSIHVVMTKLQIVECSASHQRHASVLRIDLCMLSFLLNTVIMNILKHAILKCVRNFHNSAILEENTIAAGKMSEL